MDLVNLKQQQDCICANRMTITLVRKEAVACYAPYRILVIKGLATCLH